MSLWVYTHLAQVLGFELELEVGKKSVQVLDFELELEVGKKVCKCWALIWNWM